MKKLLLSSLVLLLFSLSIFVFQISCQKPVDAQSGGTSYTLPPATTSTLGGIIVGNGLSITSSGVLSVNSISGTTPTLIFFSRTNTTSDEIWKANIDGTGQQKINITMPSGYVISINNQNTASGNGGNAGALKVINQKLIFLGYKLGVGNALFSCDFNGSNVMKLLDNCGSSYDTY